jgi:hypothetical protein
MAEKIMTVTDFIEFEKKLIKHIDSLIINSNDGIKRRWLKSRDVRKLLGNISAGKLQEMRINGEISFSKIGGMLLYDYDEIVKVLENSKVR